MRLYVVFALLCFTCVVAGCHTHEQLDNFGRCQECKFCTRPAANENWKLTMETKAASTEKGMVDAETMEKTDQIFQWVEVYKNLQTLHTAYLSRLKDSKPWYTAYSKCEITNQSWEQYWQTMTDVAIQLLKLKEIIAKRLGYLLSREGIPVAETEATLAMLNCLKQELDIYGDDLIKIIQILDNRKVLPQLPAKDKLPQAMQSFAEVAFSAERDHAGGIEMGSDRMLEQIKTNIQNIEKVTGRK
jgi:hypothetical protein